MFEEYKVETCAYEIEVAGKKYKIQAKINNYPSGRKEGEITTTPAVNGRMTFTQDFDDTQLLNDAVFARIKKEFAEEGYEILRSKLLSEKSTLLDIKTDLPASLQIEYRDNKYHAIWNCENQTIEEDYSQDSSLSETINDLINKWNNRIMEQKVYNIIREKLYNALDSVWDANRPSITLRGKPCVLDTHCPKFRIEDEEQLVKKLATDKTSDAENPTIKGKCEVWVLITDTEGDKKSVHCTFEIYGSDYSYELTKEKFSMNIRRFSKFDKCW